MTIQKRNKTPLTLITGYLGSGKTTLLRHIIANESRKFAILMNEFGQIAIDTEIIRGKNIDMMELKGGCVCCSMTGEFEAAIKEIKEKINPELIIVETTGVAEPDAIVGDIAENLEGIRLDAVVTIADADGMKKFPSMGYTGRVQIEMADIIILNKTDLVTDEDIDKIENTLKSINPSAIIYKTQNSIIDLDLILDVNINQPKKPRHDHTHHIDELGLESFTYESQARLNRRKLEEAMAGLPKDIIRAKGFAITNEGSFLINVVYGRVDLEEFPADSNRLVFIGRWASKHEESVLAKIGDCE